MSVTKSIAIGLTAALIGTGAMGGDMQIYPYHSSENYCPAGLQPITMNGVICCGTPTTTQSYQSVMAHPKPKKVRHVHKTRASDSCPEGVKGCY